MESKRRSTTLTSLIFILKRYLGLFHTYPDIFEPTTYSLRINETYSNRIRQSTRIRIRHRTCEIATREAIAFRSAAMLNIHAVKTGSEFATSSDLKISGFDRP